MIDIYNSAKLNLILIFPSLSILILDLSYWGSLELIKLSEVVMPRSINFSLPYSSTMEGIVKYNMDVFIIFIKVPSLSIREVKSRRETNVSNVFPNCNIEVNIFESKINENAWSYVIGVEVGW